jgi:tetratricopeptide (TPR) repeat protein
MKFNVVAAALLLALSTSTASFAAGESSSGGSMSGGSKAETPVSPKALKCKKGEVVKKVAGKKACTKVVSGILTDDELYQQGRALAKAGEYEWALDVLAQIEDQNQPRVLNYTGYSHRKAGRLETGVAFYQKALSIDPNFVLAREYLGEGYVAAGKIDLAKAQLEEIRVRAGTASEEFVALNKAIVEANI